MRVGVLSLQGDFAAHERVLAAIDVPAFLVRGVEELERCDAIVLPGGESTAMLRLMASQGIDQILAKRIRGGMPVLATCAGVILLARGVEPRQPSLGILDIDVLRNAYGRQLHSSVETIELRADRIGGPPSMEGVFIRAPRVIRVGAAVEVLGRRGDDPVLLVQDNIVAATFHPELTADDRIHRLFSNVSEVACV